MANLKYSRTKARKRALDILFESDLRNTDPLTTLRERAAQADPEIRPFSIELVEGVVAHQKEIDKAIAQALPRDWALSRMVRVDRNLARIAVYEIKFTDTAAEVAIAEAVKLSGELSTDDSPAFLNGVLSGVIKAKE